MSKKRSRYSNLLKLAILYLIFVGLNAINQGCSVSSLPVNPSNQNGQDSQCPLNSKCSSSGYCVCDRGYFGNCANKGQYLNSQSIQYSVTENITFFIIQPTLDEYVYYQFLLCNEESLDNDELLNLWDDDGNLVIPDAKNALGVDKTLNVAQQCTSLMTPFFRFSSQPNGEKQLLIFGIRLKNPGTLKIKLLVQESQLFGFDILFRIILVLISGIALISLGGVVYCVYKCRRNGRRNLLHEQTHEIKFFQDYMPTTKAKLTELKEQICSVCLCQFKQNQEIRPTVCGHSFHRTCLDQWCVTNLSCPICRTSFQKANLIHHQYLMSRRQSTEDKEDSIIQDDIINDQSIRKPMV